MAMQKRQKKTGFSKKSHQLRIIGGTWRSRKLDVAEVEGLRPTPDRVRETLFNWLAPEIVGARCLDLFAGSGALGLEALSRGAVQLVMVERDLSAVEMLMLNASRLGAEAVQIVHGDARAWLKSQTAGRGFDLVFLDPPFEANLLQPCLELIASSALVEKGGLLYVETPATASTPIVDQCLRLYREKTSGNVVSRLYRAV